MKISRLIGLVRGLGLFVKEIGSFYRFYRSTPQAEKAIVFYTEHPGYHPNYEGLINELLQKYKQPLSYITSDFRDPLLKASPNLINVFYVNKLLPFFMSFVSSKVFIMTMTDLQQFHIKRSIKPVHYVYIFHSIVSTHMIYREGAFDYYDSMLCVGPHQVKEIRKHEKLHKLPEKKLVEAGYYRLERIYKAYKQYSKNQPSKKVRTVLIAPSWGKHNILASVGPQLIELLLKDYAVIVRPHPEMVKANPKVLDSLSKKFSGNPRFMLETSVATDDSLFKADILICDFSGIAFEYAFGTERPVLFLDVPPKIKNPNYQKLRLAPIEVALRSKMGKIVSPKNLDSIPAVIEDLHIHRASYKKRLAGLRNEYIFAFGKASDVSARYVMNFLK